MNRKTTPGELRKVEERWLELRDQLSVFAASDEDPRVAEAARKLGVAVYNTHNRVSWHIHDMIDPQPGISSPLMYTLAKYEFERGNLLIQMVLDLVNGRDVTEAQIALARIDAEEETETAAMRGS